jgi:hypothetical protein
VAGRLVLAYRPAGFPELGGIHRLAAELVRRAAPAPCVTLVAPHPPQQDPAAVPGSALTGRLRQGDRLVVFGCDVAWAYGLVLTQRLRHPHRVVHWLPSFHDPARVRHGGKARLAQLALKLMQALGVTVHVQTPHERTLLALGRGGRCRLSCHGLPEDVRRALEQRVTDAAGDGAGAPAGEGDRPVEDRPVDLLFLGRPTRQKGWPRFLALAGGGDLRCAAILPGRPEGPPAPPPGLSMHLAPQRPQITALLRRSKLVLIPSDYESFGIAQLEAIAAGCVVPILGHWPLWDDFPQLQWQTLGDETLSAACRHLCDDPDARRALAQAQARHVLAHASARAGFLPGLGVAHEACR